MKQKLDGLNYQQAQKRNSQKFYSLSQKERQQVRQQGYKNLGWNNVRKSWNLLQKLFNNSPVDLIEFAIRKSEEKYEKAKQSENVIEVLKAGKVVIQSLKQKYQ